MRTVLARLLHAQTISPTNYRRYLNSFNSALNAVRRLSGTPATELGAVITNLHNIAAAGLLTPSRLPVLFMTLTAIKAGGPPATRSPRASGCSSPAHSLSGSTTRVRE